MASPILPDELVPEIFCHIVPPSLHTQQSLKKVEWPRIHNLSLSSRSFRRAALDCWFYSVFVRQPSDWDTMEAFPPVELAKIVSRIHVFASALDPSGLAHLARYARLKYLSVNTHVVWSESPDSPHRYLVRDLVPYLPSLLTELEVSCMSPDQCQPDLLAKVSAACPSLRRLGFYSASLNCVACAEEITLPFPIPEQFSTAEELAESLAKSLSSLKQLRSLSLPIHLSHADIYEMHLNGGHPLRRVLDRGNSCPRCVADYGPSTTENETTVAERLAGTLPYLQNVYFATWVYRSGEAGVHFSRSLTGITGMKRDLIESYADTQALDGGPLEQSG
ncbi:hypothetical protein FRC09_019172 [Ceratobasidium sp. 395]|nr:hypothetical protein FRC09_019172 [Ceratobasidium sp. 395]